MNCAAKGWDGIKSQERMRCWVVCAATGTASGNMDDESSPVLTRGDREGGEVGAGMGD